MKNKFSFLNTILNSTDSFRTMLLDHPSLVTKYFNLTTEKQVDHFVNQLAIDGEPGAFNFEKTLAYVTDFFLDALIEWDGPAKFFIFTDERAKDRFVYIAREIYRSKNPVLV
jgi:hypothetical protein